MTGPFEQRRSSRRSVNYPVELWVRGNQPVDTFKDQGLRGEIGDLSESGVRIQGVQSFNVRGLPWDSFLFERSILKVVVHTSKGSFDLWGSIVWLRRRGETADLGVRLIPIFADKVKELFLE